MEDFLQTTKLTMTSLPEGGSVHVVLGNEACDLDSAVCSLVYAYYLHQTSSHQCAYLPLLNIPRHQYRLRTEINFLLGKSGITHDLLTFTDDVNLFSLKSHLQLTLVDHHVLSHQLSPLDQCVVRVIDHRPVEKTWGSSVVSTVEMVGSCCTLVMEEITKGKNFHLDQVTAKLLLGTILTDTINLSEAAGKTTARDVAAINQLKLIVGDIDLQMLYDGIHHAKSDISGLNSLELLEKDLKMLQSPTVSIAVSSIMINIKELVEKEDLLTALTDFSALKSVTAVVIMTMTTHGEHRIPQRQLAVFSDNLEYRQQIAEVLETCNSPNLQLERTGDTAHNIIFFNQANVQASRKKVIPILKAFLNGEKTPEDSRKCIEPFVSGSQDGFSSLVDLSDSGKGGSQGVNDRQAPHT